jgi:hypothetical protein
MKIKQEVIETQGNLSKMNIAFLEYVEKNPDCFNRSDFHLLELNDQLFSLQPWPTFINRKSKEAFREAGEKLFDLIKQIPKRVFNNDPQKMNAYYHQPINLIQLQMDGVSKDHLDHLVSRGDFILSPAGLKCVEYNVTVNLGGWQIPIWESLYLNTPIIGRFFQEYQVKNFNKNLLSLFLDHMIHSSLTKISPSEAELNIALVVRGVVEGANNTNWIDSTRSYLNVLYKESLQRIAESLTGSVIVCNFHHLHLLDDCLYYKDKKIHGAAETCHGMVSPDVMTAFKTGNIRLINGPITDVLSSKLNLALLSDYQTTGVFTARERKIIDAFVPWTRKIKPGSTTYKAKKINDLEYFIRSHREKLVIKPALGYGGKKVCVGNKVSQELWEKNVNTAFQEKDWVVQELVESSTGIYQSGEKGCDYHDMVWGFFIFGSRYTGAWVRVMPQESNKGVINCHQGATVSVIFETDE